MRYIELLASYLPSLVVEEILELEKDERETRRKHDPSEARLATYDAACLFADVSGFTRLSESMSFRHGPHVGPEHLAKQLNSYFSQLVKIINSEGGDVFKFAGDAMIVLWPPTSDEESIGDRAGRAIQSAVRIQGLGKGLTFDDDAVSLSIKIGIGVGSLAILHLGGVKGRTEYVAVGEPMSQAFAAEGMANAGDVVFSPATHKQLPPNFFQVDGVEGDGKAPFIKLTGSKRSGRQGAFYRVDMSRFTVKKRARNKRFGVNLFDSYTALTEKRIRQLIPSAALQSINSEHPEFEYYSSELRRVSVVFISLGLSEGRVQAAAKGGEEMQLLHEAMRIVQTAAYKYEGALNKFIVDDKGATIIVLFGLPPYSHENDAKRAVSSSLYSVGKLREELGLDPAAGITSGTAFCGVLGSQTRKEYSVLGDIVNLSARFMQASKQSLDDSSAGFAAPIICDEATYVSCNRDIPFRTLPAIKVKGKAAPIEAFEPLASAELMAEPTAKPSKKTLRFGTNRRDRTESRQRAVSGYSSEGSEDFAPGATMQLLGPRFPLATHSSEDRQGSLVSGEHVQERFVSIDLLASDRLHELEESAEKKNEDLRMYFRMPPSLLGGRAQRKRNVSVSNDHRRRSSSGAAAGMRRASQRLAAVITSATTPKGKGGVASRAELDTEDVEDDEFVEEFPYRASSRESFPADEGTHGLRRKSLIFYNEVGPSAHLQKGVGPSDPDYEETCLQVAVGAPSLYRVVCVDRFDQGQQDTKALLENACAYSQSAGLLRRGVDPESVALVIQGTEVVLSMAIWSSNRDRLTAAISGEPPGLSSLGVPLKYMEAIVNEALSFGEIWRSSVETLSQKGVKRSDTPRRALSANSTSAMPYNDKSGNGGVTLKLVLVPRSDVVVLQSPNSYVLQSLMARKIELLEHSKGSVVVIAGEPGSGKTHLLKRFGYGFLANTVPVLGSSEHWEHTTSEYERLFQLKGDSDQFQKFRNEERHFHVWFDIILQWIFHEASDLAKSTLRKQPAKVRTQILAGVLDSDLAAYASLLNEDLGTAFDEPKGEAAALLDRLSPSQHLAQVNALVTDMICDIVTKVVAKYSGLVILIDDALRLDEHSWGVAVKLAELVCSDALSLMLVVSTRPFEGLADRTMGLQPRLIQPRTRAALGRYRELCSVDGVEVLSMGPLSRNLAVDVFRKHVGENIQTISFDLWRVCESRCFNNPLLIKDFAYEIREARRPKLVRYTAISNNNKKQSKRAPGFDPSLRYMASLRVAVQHLDEPAWTMHAAHRAALSRQAAFLAERTSIEPSAPVMQDLPTGNINEDEMETVSFPANYYPPAEVAPPRTAAGVLGEMVDRLGSIEQMVLRIACMVGSTFSLRLIQDVYPRNSLPRDFTASLVKAACENLADQHGIFHKVRANAYNDEYVYRFADMLLVSALRHRLLKKHKLSLAANITRARSHFKAALELEKLQSEDSALLTPRPASLALINQKKQAGGSAPPSLKEGFLAIKKKNPTSNKFVSDWKERYVLLRNDCILVFKKRDPRRMGENDAHVVIYFNEASVELVEDTTERVHPIAFRVIAEEWSRRGELNYILRDFTFANADAMETRRWFSRVSMTLNRHKLGARFVDAVDSMASAKNILPVRRRTILDYGALLDESESGLVLTVRHAGQVDAKERFSSLSSRGPSTKHLSSPNNRMTEIYASAFINLRNGVRLVRKQTMLTVPAHSELLEFNESFVFKLAPDFLVDWANQPERNASLDIVLWRQNDSALGFDIMVGYCSVLLAEVYSRQGSAPRIDLDLQVTEPYASVKSHEAVLNVGLELVVREDDKYQIEAMQDGAGFGDASRDAGLVSQREVAEEIFQDNMELNVRSETGREGGNFADPTGVGRGKTLQRPKKSKTRTMKHGLAPMSMLASANGDRAGTSEGNGLPRTNSMQLPRPRYMSSTNPNSRRGTMASEPGNSMGPLASPLALLDFAAKASRTPGERDLLGVLKRLLLTRSFAELVSPVSLDEKSRKWLGSQFTRATVRHESEEEALNGAAKRLSTTSLPSAVDDLGDPEDSAAQLETLANAYVQACRRPVTYVDEDTAVQVGPTSLAAVLGQIGRGVTLMTTIGVFSDADAKTEPEDELPLASYLDELRTQALDVARAAIGQRLQADENSPDGKGQRGALPNAVFQRSASSSTLVSNGGQAFNGPRSGSVVFSTAATMAAVAAAAAARKKQKKPRRRKKKTESWNGLVSRFGKFVGKQRVSDPRMLDPSSWFFDLQLVPVASRVHLVAHMFRIMSIDTQFAVPVDCFVGFVERVEKGMSLHHAWYHNFDHACDVLQATFVMLTTMQGADFFDDVQTFGLMIAAFCHDLEHPGTNNPFQVKAETALAKLYEGQSVLESHHCACTFELLNDESTNIIRNMEAPDALRFRQIVLECILATDMTCHFDLTGELRDCIVRHLDDPTSSMDDEERGLVAKSILHCADISNPTRSWTSSKRWQDLICEEFYAQGDLERRNNWEVSANMDRATTHQAEMSINFIDFIVAPLFLAMSTLLPNSSDPCTQMASNRAKWMDILLDELPDREDLDSAKREKAFHDWASREVTFQQVLASAGFADGGDGGRSGAGSFATDLDDDDLAEFGHGPDDVGDFGTISRRKGSNAAVAYIDATDEAARSPSPRPSL